MHALASQVQEAIASQSWLAWAQPYIERAPDWALLTAPVLAFLLLVWGALGFTEKRQRMIRIGTWNIDTASADKNSIRRSVLQGHEADIWVLTETHDELSPGDEFSAVHSDQADVAVAPRKLREGNRWVSIWSRYPIIRQIEVKDRQRTVAALIDTPASRLLVYGVVLPWQGQTPGFKAVVEGLAAEWLELQRKFPDASLCIAGDFNAWMNEGDDIPGKPGIVTLHQAMKACALSCATQPGKVPNGWLKEPPIDHVLLPNNCSAKIVHAWDGPPAGLTDEHHSLLVVSAKFGPHGPR
jgi:endonuclease/exonuclease/phosphatase family metal-dependent hydrolase